MRREAGIPRVLSREGAFARGFTRRQIDRRIATGQWQRVLPRVYLTADTYTWLDRVDAALLFGGADTMLSGAAALIESGIALPAPAQLLLLAPRTSGVRSVAGVRVAHPRRMPAAVPWFGARRAPVERAVVDHVRCLRRLDDVRTIVARAVRSGECSVDELAAELAVAPRNGTALLRQALTEVTTGAASAPEAAAARALRRAGSRIPPFEQNARIDLPNRRYYVADFLWPQLAAILEIDSVEYHLDPVDWRRTQDRHLALTTLGYSVVHRPPSAVRDAARFVGEIAAWLASQPLNGVIR